MIGRDGAGSRSTGSAARATLFGLVGIVGTSAFGWALALEPISPRPVTGRQTLQRPGVATPPAFREDAWHLPDEPLLGFVEIPAGAFLMGSDPSVDPMAFETEQWAPGQTRGTLEVPTFYIGRYEVTVAQFEAFVEDTGFAVDPRTLTGAADYPVAFVSWPDALAYARWLESRLRDWPDTPAELSRRLAQGWRVSLPSEAEWEKAARGTDGRIFPWGNAPGRDRANYARAGRASVGSLRCVECAHGLSDMSGNVWEWTRSPYQPYPYDETDDRENLEEDALWVMRGGGYNDTEQNARAAVRGAADPGVRREFIGFRLALTSF